MFENLRPVLKRANEVSFDPLGVAAVLHNPRAELSAARLYTQPDNMTFRWPHTMMIGGVLTPLSVLADYLSSKVSSLDPAVSMSQKQWTTLPVRSTTVFRELPISHSNVWLHDALAFKSSSFPENDFVVAGVEDLYIHSNFGASKAPPFITTLDILGYICGLLNITGLLFSVFTSDVWAITLFGVYALHWTASTAISFNPLVKPQEIHITPDATQQYCVYKRPEGGTVIFKGRKDALERWARSTWKFDPKPLNHLLHWCWAITGSFASLASVACMVNMTAYLQLGFLALLAYSSLAEILATRLARGMQVRACSKYLGSKTQDRQQTFIFDNKTRSMGIIRATLSCQLDANLWFTLELLPNIPVFAEMLTLVDSLRMIDDETRMQEVTGRFRNKFGAINSQGKIITTVLAHRIASEAEDAWRELKAFNRHSSVT